jgi:hypothetical protein
MQPFRRSIHIVNSMPLGIAGTNTPLIANAHVGECFRGTSQLPITTAGSLLTAVLMLLTL